MAAGQVLGRQHIPLVAFSALENSKARMCSMLTEGQRVPGES